MLTGYTGATRGLVDFVAVPCLGIQPSLTVVLLCVLLGVDLTVDAIVPACPLVALALALSRAGPATIEATIYCSILPLKILYLPLPLPSFLSLLLSSTTRPHLSSTTPKLWGWKEDSSLRVLASTKDWFIKGLWPFCSSLPSSSTTSSVPTLPTRGRKSTASRPSTPKQLRRSTNLPGR